MKFLIVRLGNSLLRWLVPLVALLLSALFTANAQEIEKEAAIYLKNGMVIKGKLLMSMYDEYMTVQTSPADRMEIRYDKIDRILFGNEVFVKSRNYSPALTQSPDTIPPFFSKPGFLHATDISVIGGNNDNGETTAFSISTINGYRFNNYLGAGVGIGLDVYDRVTMLPLFLSVRGQLKKEDVTPFYFLNIGHSFAWENDPSPDVNYDYVEGGFMLQPGLGYMFSLGKVAVNFSFSFKMQHSEVAYSYENGWVTSAEVHEERTRKRLTMGIGINF